MPRKKKQSPPSEVAVIVVGTGEWEYYTLPFLRSLLEMAPELAIVCVDNGSQYPEVEGVQMVHLPDVVCYAAALNRGMEAAPAAWYWLCNNDMLLLSELPASRFEALSDDSLYAWVMNGPRTVGFPYLESWSMIVPERIRSAIGAFDENFKPMWFEGADYCYRAEQAGFKMAPALDRQEWGIYHFEDERMDERKAYMRRNMDARIGNRRYLWKKHGLHFG